MQFGMPTLIEIKSLESCAALCHELGLAFVELNMNLPEYQVDRLEETRFCRIADKYGIFFTIHLDENLNPCDFNNKVAAAYIETVLQTIKIAKRLSIPVLNMHLCGGVWFTLPDRKVFLFDEYEAEYLQKLKVFRDVCEREVGNADIKICVENCGDYGSRPHIRKSLPILLESPVFALTFDIGHNAGADYSDAPIIMKYADRLHHFHIHDTKGSVNHLILGDGDVDLMKYLCLARKHNCRSVLEVKTVDGLRRSVEWLTERIDT